MKASDVLDTVLTTISRYSMLTSGTRVIAAVSGGPDSVCLFHVLRELAPHFGATLAGVAHLNHKLRGAASDEDERFVAAIAAEHGVAFHREEAHFEGRAGNLEQAARQARQSFFSRLIQQGVADRIATGHTSDDQAETVLFRVLRGCGIAGLAGVLPVTNEGLIRPLLDVSRAEIEEFLESRGIAWREDSTNREGRFARNKIRHELLPQLAREWNPQISKALSQLADLAREEEQWWKSEINRRFEDLFSRSNGEVEVCADELAALPKAIARRLVRFAIERQSGHPADYSHVEGILDLAQRPEGTGTLQLPGLVVMRSFGRLRFMRPGRPLIPEAVPVQIPGKYQWAGGSIGLAIETPGPRNRETNFDRTGCARLKLCGGRDSAPLELRGWRAGDHYRPAGRSRDHKIKEMFQEASVPSWQRYSWPIITSGSKILWARDFGAAAEFAADRETSPVLCIWEERSHG